jgi:hypothetical protein
MDDAPQFTAFEDTRRVTTGSRTQVAQALNALLARQPDAAILIFDDATGGQIDFDLRGTGEEIAPRLAGSQLSQDGPEAARGPGRPKLGVVAREVTLLPRHWEWLAKQPGGASVTLRKLVEDARRANAGAATAREAQERAYRFMSAMAGNLPGFEEATRALFGKDRSRFETLIAEWPESIRDYAHALADGAFTRST